MENSTYAVMALVATLGLFLGAIALAAADYLLILPQQHANAKGCTNGIAFNASKGRCFGH